MRHCGKESDATRHAFVLGGLEGDLPGGPVLVAGRGQSLHHGLPQLELGGDRPVGNDRHRAAIVLEQLRHHLVDIGRQNVEGLPHLARGVVGPVRHGREDLEVAKGRHAVDLVHVLDAGELDRRHLQPLGGRPGVDEDGMEHAGRAVGLLAPGLGRPGPHLPLLVGGIELLPDVLQQLGGGTGIGPGQERSDGGGDGALVQRDVGPAARLDEGLGGGIRAVPAGNGDGGGDLEVALLGIGLVVGLGDVLGVVLVGLPPGLGDDDPHGLVGQHGQALLLAVDGQVEGDAVKVVVVGLGRPVERAVADGDGVGPGGGGLLGDGGPVGVGHLVQGQGGGVQVGRAADAEEQMGLDDPGRPGLVLGCLLVFH